MASDKVSPCFRIAAGIAPANKSFSLHFILLHLFSAFSVFCLSYITSSRMACTSRIHDR